jgi:RNA polymerase sigma factor (sigma-70 family)
MKPLVEDDSVSDAELVALCLRNDRQAFGTIVARYQSAVCGIAYSSCGDLGLSEDLAQDTFVAAWRSLGQLKEPAKLKSWLCGIARNLIHKSLRREERTPTAQAAPLPEGVSACEASPQELAMSREEESLVWQALESIPPEYREPMVLFYREGKSTAAVAEMLDLSDDAVRQRLSRGRLMLNERLARTVEDVLRRSGPTKVFTLAVLAALPALATSAKAATLGVAAAQGGATASKAMLATGMLSALSGPLMGIFSAWMSYRMNMAAARSDEERSKIRKFYSSFMAGMAVFFAGLFLLIRWRREFAHVHPQLFWVLTIGLSVGWLVLGLRQSLALRRAAQKESLAHPKQPCIAWEYRSKQTLAGWPLVHIRIGEGQTGWRDPVKAWFAAGDFAIGLIGAFGAIAIAPLSIGALAMGLLPWGGLAVGLMPIGGLAVGGWAFGGLAFGWRAYGGCALAWDAAMGGYATAREFAEGGFAQAAQANNQAAREFFAGSPYFQAIQWVGRYVAWFNLLWILPMMAWWRIIAQQARSRK